MNFKPLKIVLFFTLLMLLPEIANAQCAMCRAVLESQEDAGTAKGINNGIIYLMVIPYVLIGVVGYFVYKSLTKKGKF